MRSHPLSYHYTDVDQLDKPHSYAYSQFGGKKFLSSYVSDRLKRISPYSSRFRSTQSSNLLFELSAAAQSLGSLDELESFLLGETIRLKPLLRSLLAVLGRNDYSAAHPWMARVVQRFEVSKKLYPTYGANFRGGVGAVDDLERYVEFGLCLAISYELSGRMQYLSTLLKVNDLLLSIDLNLSLSPSTARLLALAVAAELRAVFLLAEKCGVSIDA